ncbi:transcriptional regulator [Sphingobium lactosutens]|uniref:transcriptional regulator n=1 Tax=Sphingobium lactosutens TaxID=522773 RepID=UPI0004CE33AC|nr:YdaS family helix-turn-helix protein [Sphingobium lactosutens]
MSLTLSPIQALQQAVETAGSQSALARLLKVSQHAVWHWLNKGDAEKPLPAEHVLKVEEATGISRHDLRPDLYPREAIPSPQGDDDRLEGVRP